jgi:type II secretory pathway component PulF
MIQALPAAVCARLFEQWAALDAAGVAPIQAFERLDVPAPHRSRLRRVAAALAKGRSLSEALTAARLFTEVETSVIGAAALAGDVGPALKRLAHRARQRHARESALRTRLLLPLALLGALLLLMPLPALIAGNLSAGRYLAQSLGILGLAGVAIWMVSFRPISARRHAIGVDAVLLRLPWIGSLIRRDQLQQFAETLALLSGAGIPLLSALPTAADGVRWPSIYEALMRWQSALENGSTFAQAAASHPIEDSEALQAAIVAGESVGDLARSLSHFAMLAGRQVESDQQVLMEWVPRIVYLLIVVAAASGIVGAFGQLLARGAG